MIAKWQQAAAPVTLLPHWDLKFMDRRHRCLFSVALPGAGGVSYYRAVIAPSLSISVRSS
jgi:hypothetical protein